MFKGEFHPDIELVLIESEKWERTSRDKHRVANLC